MPMPVRTRDVGDVATFCGFRLRGRVARGCQRDDSTPGSRHWDVNGWSFHVHDGVPERQTVDGSVRERAPRRAGSLESVVYSSLRITDHGTSTGTAEAEPVPVARDPQHQI